MDKTDLIVQQSEKAFLQERARADKLIAAAEKYIAAVAVIIGFKLLDIENLSLTGSWQQIVHGWLTVLALLTLGTALLLTFWSMRVFKYYAFPRGTKLIDELKDPGISDEAAKIKVARMYLSAHDTNAQINDRRARLLSVSSALLVAGFLLTVIGYLTGLLD